MTIVLSLTTAIIPVETATVPNASMTKPRPGWPGNPHVHYLVTGGGVSPDGQLWQAAHPDFLVHVKPLSRLFRAKFRAELHQTHPFEQVPPKVWRQTWVVHCQPVGNGQATLKYLTPYVLRIALSHKGKFILFGAVILTRT